MIQILNLIDDVMYFPILIIVMAIAGLYFTIRTKGVQIRLFPESVRLLLEPKEDKESVSSLQAMLVSTASRVGTGNIIGVSTAICLGGPGAASGCGSCVLSEHPPYSLKVPLHRSSSRRTMRVMHTEAPHITSSMD